jgi:hypothetical protein
MGVVVTERGEVEVALERDGGSLRVATSDLATATGWELKPEGLCQGEVCVPVRDPAGLVVGDHIDLAELGRRVGRLAVIDADEGIAAFADHAPASSPEPRSLVAPDAELPDLEGHLVALRDYAGRKRMLVAWASW